MKGRNGIDNLAWAAFISAVVLNLIDGFAQTGVLSLPFWIHPSCLLGNLFCYNLYHH